MKERSAAVASWAETGERVAIDEGEVWFRVVRAATDVGRRPLLAIHGFPTCSYDWKSVLPALAAERDVIVFDLLGFGLSDKPDRRYSIELAADVTTQVVAHLGLTEVDLITHDMGDTVGGELLARSLDGDLPFDIGRRVLTNGSIYLDLANLTEGQRVLLELPDEREPLVGADGGSSVKRTLLGTFGPRAVAGRDEMDALIEFGSIGDGWSLLPRLIRYIEDRRARESRYTGAIETHPSPVAVIWGSADPVADYSMAEKLVSRRLDAHLVTLGGIGHFPMLEAPDLLAEAALAHLDAL